MTFSFIKSIITYEVLSDTATDLQILPVSLKVSASIYYQKSPPVLFFPFPSRRIPPVCGATFCNSDLYLFPFKYCFLHDHSELIACVKATRSMSLCSLTIFPISLLHTAGQNYKTIFFCHRNLIQFRTYKASHTLEHPKNQWQHCFASKQVCKTTLPACVVPNGLNNLELKPH